MERDSNGLRQVPLPEIWKVEPREYLHGPYRIEIQKTLPRLDGGYPGKPASEYGDRFDLDHPYAVPGHDDYMIARSLGTDAMTAFQCLLLHRKDDGQVVAVGAVDEWGLYIQDDANHRGKGLGGELAYASAAFSGELNAGYALYSKSGYAAFRKAHELAVGRALEAGLDVAASIVAQHPRLDQSVGHRPR